MNTNQGSESPKAEATDLADSRNAGQEATAIQDSSRDYVLRMLKGKEQDLLAERRFLPVLLGDERERKRAGVPFLGVAVLAIEGGFALYFLQSVMKWPLWLAAPVAAGLLSGLSLGLKRKLDSQYSKAQNAAVAARHFLNDDRGEK